MSKVKPPRNQSKLLTTGEVARYCDVSTNAVKKWIRNGRLKAFRTPGGHFRVDSEDFREFLLLHKMPVYAEFFEKKGRRILLVDDDSQVREMLTEVLRAMDMDLVVEQAEDGYDALLKAGHSKPDLLVSALFSSFLSKKGFVPQIHHHYTASLPTSKDKMEFLLRDAPQRL